MGDSESEKEKEEIINSGEPKKDGKVKKPRTEPEPPKKDEDLPKSADAGFTPNQQAPAPVSKVLLHLGVRHGNRPVYINPPNEEEVKKHEAFRKKSGRIYDEAEHNPYATSDAGTVYSCEGPNCRNRGLVNDFPSTKVVM